MGAANVFAHSVFVPETSALGFGSDEATAVVIIVTDGDPNASITAAKGSLALDTASALLWQNSDGGSTWAKVGLQT
jgi:hypothetical protein